MAIYKDGPGFGIASLTSEMEPFVKFESSNFAQDATVKITIGDFSGNITRQELLAAATLFPPKVITLRATNR